MADTHFDSSVDVDSLSVGGTAVTATAAELNLIDNLTTTAAETNMAADVSSFKAAYTATAPAAIPATVRVIELNHASTAIEKTIASLVPYAGQFVFIKDISATGTAAHTVTVTTGTFNGTHKVATLNALNEALLVFVDSAGNGTVILNAGEVALT
jgi:hypothetical protein